SKCSGLLRTEATAPLYVKAGIENVAGMTLSTVLANNGELDFSTTPLTKGEDASAFTLEVVKYDYRLLVLLVMKGADGQEEKIPVRVIYWCLKEDSRRENMWVGVYAARPDAAGEATEALDVDIINFEVEDEHGTVQLA
ncbi:hypothetical protein FOXB_06431, partial [Fusarium oxysporum f. sp. conglutinans Fo5176]